MAKKKITKKKRQLKEYESVLSSDEERFDETGANENDGSDSDSDLLSEENISSLKKDKLYLNKDDYGDLMSEEEVMSFSSDESDESEEDNLTSFYKIKAKKDEMGSDLDEEEEKDIPSAKAWGKKKGTYYSTDYVDKDYRKFTQQDEELALAEEEEALQAQKRLLDEINDADIGFELYEKEAEDIEEINIDDCQQKLEVDLSLMKSNEKRKLLQRTCPEISPLIDNFVSYLEEVRDNILPILKMGKEPIYKVMKKSVGYKFLEIKFALAMRYALNISFYMALKCNQIDTKNHPITKTLFTYNKLLNELSISPKFGQLNKEINEIFARLKRNEEILFSEQKEVKDFGNEAKKNASSLKNIRQNSAMIPNDKSSKKVTFAINKDEDKEEDVDLFGGEDNVSEDDEENADEELMNTEEESSKRAITYQIAKNKGLTAKKKKELRNPRVKHRTKFKKALARRKGQVRAPRKEIKKYSGELSGIRSSVVKSVKFK